LNAFSARSFGKAQRDKARERLLQHGFGAIETVEAGIVRFAPPLARGRFAATG